MTETKTPSPNDAEILEALPGGILDSLNDPWDEGRGDGDTLHSIKTDVLEIARAVLARWGAQPAPVREPQPMPDLTQLTERGAEAWAGVDAQGLRDGAASAGSEPVAHLWQHSETGRTRVVMPDMVVDACATWLLVGPLYLHPSPPEGMVGGWIASKDQMPPPGVRVFWGDVDSHRVGYDSWAGDDYRWAPSHWMHIPEFPSPPTTSAGSGKGE